MTRFERELHGLCGDFFKKKAIETLEERMYQWETDELLVNPINGVATWASNGNPLPEECALQAKLAGVPIDVEATRKARDEHLEEFAKNYRHEVTAEEMFEMKAAFGEGTTVVNVLTGEKIKL